MSVHVRQATVGDVRAIALVHVRSWQAAHLGLLPAARVDYFTVERREQGWIDLLAEPGDNGQQTLVALAGDETIIGFGALSAPSRDEDAGPRTGEIAALYVDPGHWRAGAGRALVLRSLCELGLRDCDEACVWVIAANTRARAFYARCALEPDGARRTEDGVAQLRLRTALRSAPPVPRTAPPACDRTGRAC